MFVEQARWSTGGCIDSSIAWSADGQWLAAASRASSMKRYMVEPHVHQNPQPSVFHTNFPLDWVACSADSLWIAGLTRSFDQVLVWNLQDPLKPAQPKHQLKHNDAAVSCAALSPDGRHLATGASGDALPYSVTASWNDDQLPNPCLRIWELATGTLTRRLIEVPDLISGITWLSNERIAMSTKRDGAPILILDTLTGHVEGIVSGHHTSLEHLASKPGSSPLLIATAGRCIFVFDLRTMHLCQQLKLHEGQITSLALSENGTTLITGGQDGMIVVSEITQHEVREQQRLIQPHNGRPIRSVAWRPGHCSFASTGDDVRVCVWTFQSYS